MTLDELDRLLGEETTVDRREFVHGAALTAASVVAAGVEVDGGTRRFGVRDVSDLRASVGRATRLEWASQYAALDVVLPGLLGDALRTSSEARAVVEQEAAGLLSQVHGLAAWVLIKKDRPGEAEAAAQEALAVAKRVNDSPVAGAALRCLGEVHMRAGRYGVACDLAVEAAEMAKRSRGNGEPALVVQGAGYLSAAMACARGGDGPGAHELLTAASVVADQLGRDCSGLAVFGPSNVGIHRVAIPLELGDPLTAIRHAESARFDGSLSAEFGERAGRYLIDVARAYAARKRDEDAMLTLLQAEQAAPEEVRTHRLTRGVLRDLLARERRGRTPELRALASRCALEMS